MARIEKRTLAFLASVAILVVFSQLEDVSAQDECTKDSDCSRVYVFKKYCCDRSLEDNVCGTSCVGESCVIDSDCSPTECCKYGVCSSSSNCECKSDAFCPLLQYCCERKYPYDNICASNCIGESCYINSDCAPGECCDSDSKCTTGNCDYGLAGWVVAVIVISAIVVIVIPIGIAVFCCFCAAATSRRPAQGGIVATQTGTTSMIATQNQYPAQQGQPTYFQTAPPYPDQPPAYQPTAAAYPPPSAQMAMM